MSVRDRSIDDLRGAAMIWVIAVHALYWGNFFTSGTARIIHSFCLLEMPLLFFVTGAACGFSRETRALPFILKRYRRLLIPYWFYALLCAAVSIAYAAIKGTGDAAAAFRILLSWLIPADRQITALPYLTWALWYVPVYLLVVLTIPLAKRLKRGGKGPVYLAVTAGLFVAACLLQAGWIQHVPFYAFWTGAGLYYADIPDRLSQRHFRACLAVTALAAAAGLTVMGLTGRSLDMQQNKFPPNLTFGVYSVMMIACVILLMPALSGLVRRVRKSRTADKVLDIFSLRSMTVFLYQSFAFTASIRLTNLIIPAGSTLLAAVKTLVCFVITVPLCALLAVVFGRAEKI